PGAVGIKIWEVRTKQIRATITNEIRALGLTDGGRTLVTISTNYFLRFWDWKDGRLKKHLLLSSNNDPLTRVQLAPDAKTLATATAHGLVSFWDATDGRSLGAIQADRRFIWGVVFSAD